MWTNGNCVFDFLSGRKKILSFALNEQHIQYEYLKCLNYFVDPRQQNQNFFLEKKYLFEVGET